MKSANKEIGFGKQTIAKVSRSGTLFLHIKDITYGKATM